VSDVVHLIAELAENATVYSPPHTDVRLQTRISRGAIVIEIHDRGIGIPEDQRNELNERLASPRADNVELSRMMGLYVVARLAARHGITVTLTQVTGHGTVAVVTLPATLLDATSDPAPDSSGEADAESWGAP
ncbi:MAG: sensor histidine kinase, partial [Mycobacteriales bacterium]